MFYRHILRNNFHKYALHRPFTDFNRILTNDLLSKYRLPSYHQHRLNSVFSATHSKNGLQNIKSNVFILRRIFCTKPPTKSEHHWLTIRQQSKQSGQEIKRLLGFAKKEKWYYIGGIACLVVSSLVTNGVPAAVGKILDMIIMDNFPKDKVHIFCLALLAIFVVGGLANFGRIYLMNSAGK